MATDMFDFLAGQQYKTVEKRNWMNSCEWVLGTDENLSDVIDQCLNGPTKRVAIDLETSGLDNRVFNGSTVDYIVGVCLCPDGKTGFYIPLRHRTKIGGEYSPHPANVSWSKFEKEFRRLIGALEAGDVVSIFHNAEFDQEFLQFWGGEPFGTWERVKQWDDTLILAYLWDARRKKRGLKTLSKELVNIEQIELDEFFNKGDKKDFSVLDPSDDAVLWYAGGDAIATYRLDEYLRPLVLKPNKHGHQQRMIYAIERMCISANRWMMRNRVHVDRPKILELIKLGQREWYNSMLEVYRGAQELLGRDVMPGYFRYLADIWNPEDPEKFFTDQVDLAKKLGPTRYPDPKEAHRRGSVGADGKEWPLIYDINSAAQLGKLLWEMKVPGLQFTEGTGQVKTDKKTLDRIFEKAGGRYPFLDKVKRYRETARALVNYLLPMYIDAEESDDTMRINFKAQGTDTGRFSTPAKKKKKGVRFPGWPSINLQSMPATYDPNRPECMRRLRECFSVRKPDSYMVACIEEGSLVPTSRGLIPIEQIQQGDSVRTEEGLVTVGPLTAKGVQPVVRLTTNKGFTLRLTPEHLVRTVDVGGLCWKPAGEMCPGDWVIQVTRGTGTYATELIELPQTPEISPWETPIRTPKYLSENMAEMLGRFIGDGYVGHTKGKPRYVGFSLGEDMEELLLPLNTLAKTHFGIIFTPKAKGDVQKHSNPLARWWKEVSGKTSTRDLKVPPHVWRSSLSVQAAFLRGLFDADGFVGNRPGDGVTLWITSDSLAQGVQILLLEQGIQSTRKAISRKTNFSNQTGWLLSIHGIQNLRKYRDVVGFLTERKQDRIEKLVLEGRNRDMTEVFPLQLSQKAVPRQRFPETNRIHTNGKRKGRVSRQLLEAARKRHEDIDPTWMSWLLESPICYDTVKSVVPDGVAQVYDINVPGVRHFQANGIEVHNCDYAGVELRLVTNLSKEPKWLAEYFRCSECQRTFPKGDGQTTPEAPPPRCPNCGSDRIGDLHTLTALEIYGQDAPNQPEWKQLRQNSKATNFALCYGGGGMAVIRATSCSKNEGYRIKKQFDETYRDLALWWRNQHAFAREKGYVLTAFGRKYPVPDINHEQGGFQAKAERNAVNGPIQGSSADITKLAMGLIYKECSKRGWLDKCMMIITMHDELVFEIDGDILEEAITVISNIMCHNDIILAKKWPIPLTSDVEIGHDWTVPWDLNSMRAGEVRFQGDQKFKKKVKAQDAGVDWDQLPSFPAILQPLFRYQTLEAIVNADWDNPDPLPDPDAPPTPPSTPPPPSSAPPVDVPPQTQQMTPPAGLKSGDQYTHRLNCPLSIGAMEALAHVVVECQGRGSKILALESLQGTPLSGWEPEGHPVLVNEQEFFVLARHRGL